MQRRLRNRFFSSGLTLTEILIVVGIITFLVLMAMWYFRNQIFKGNDAKRKGDIKRIQVAIEEYEKDNNCYPLPHLVVCNPGDGLKPYLSKVPCDPITKASYYYNYEDSTCPSWYRIYAKLENTSDKDITANIGPYGAYNYYATSPNAPALSGGGGGDGDGGGDGESSDFYGCKSSVCVPILWDPSRPGPECDPNYQNPTCYGQCGPAETECQPWDQ